MNKHETLPITIIPGGQRVTLDVALTAIGQRTLWIHYEHHESPQLEIFDKKAPTYIVTR